MLNERLVDYKEEYLKCGKLDSSCSTQKKIKNDVIEKKLNYLKSVIDNNIKNKKKSRNIEVFDNNKKNYSNQIEQKINSKITVPDTQCQTVTNKTKINFTSEEMKILKSKIKSNLKHTLRYQLKNIIEEKENEIKSYYESQLTQYKEYLTKKYGKLLELEKEAIKMEGKNDVILGQFKIPKLKDKYKALRYFHKTKSLDENIVKDLTGNDIILPNTTRAKNGGVQKINNNQCYELRIKSLDLIHDSTFSSFEEFENFLLSYVKAEYSMMMYIDKFKDNYIQKIDKKANCKIDLLSLINLWKINNTSSLIAKKILDYLLSRKPNIIKETIAREIKGLEEYREKTKNIVELIYMRENMKNRSFKIDKITNQILEEISEYKNKYKSTIIWKGLEYEYLIKYDQYKLKE